MDTFEVIVRELESQFPFKEYFEPTNKYGIYKSLFNISNKYLNPNSKVLDYGCGACDKAVLLALMGHEVHACDDFMDPWHKVEDNEKKIFNFASRMDVNIIKLNENYVSFTSKKFDLIMLNDVIEHFHDSPKKLLTYLKSKLNPGGIILIIVPNAGNIRKRIDLLLGKTNMPSFRDFWYSDPFRGHVREYVKNDLLLIGKFLKLKIIMLKGKNHMLVKIPFILRKIYVFIIYFLPNMKDTWVMVMKNEKK